MLFTVSINRFKVHAPVGVYDFEKEKGNDLEIDIKMKVNIDSSIISTDALEGVVNYAEIAELTADILRNPINLLETAVYRVATAIAVQVKKTNVDVEEIKVKIAKLNPPIGTYKLESASAELDIKL